EGVSASTNVTVQPPAVQAVSATLDAASLLPGQTTQAHATTRDANGAVLTDRVVSWRSLNPALATVSPTGLVTAVVTGSVTIRATSENVTGDAALTVAVPPTPAPVAIVAVTLGSPNLSPGQSTQAIAVAKDANGNTLTGRGT